MKVVIGTGVLPLLFRKILPAKVRRTRPWCVRMIARDYATLHVINDVLCCFANLLP